MIWILVGEKFNYMFPLLALGTECEVLTAYLGRVYITNIVKCNLTLRASLLQAQAIEKVGELTLREASCS